MNKKLKFLKKNKNIDKRSFKYNNEQKEKKQIRFLESNTRDQ